MGGKYMVGVNSEHGAAAGVVPADLAEALDADPHVRSATRQRRIAKMVATVRGD